MRPGYFVWVGFSGDCHLIDEYQCLDDSTTVNGRLPRCMMKIKINADGRLKSLGVTIHPDLSKISAQYAIY